MTPRCPAGPALNVEKESKRSKHTSNLGMVGPSKMYLAQPKNLSQEPGQQTYASESMLLYNYTIRQTAQAQVVLIPTAH